MIRWKKKGIEDAENFSVEGTAEMEEDKIVEVSVDDKSGSLEIEHERGVMRQETSNVTERVQEAVNKQTKRLTRKVLSPIKTRRPLRELNKQGSNQIRLGKRKITLRDEDMEDEDRENQKGKKSKSFEMMVVLETDQVEVESFPNGALKEI